ncbi:MAG: hypothetical protein ACI91B_000911 [Planctomycetota bacterium]|jgi:hypothetical protein
MRRIILTVTALLALPLQSCCSLARLFCGPDKSEWISVRFDSPEHTVRTFLEALRRDDPDVVYQCLSEPLRKRLGVDQDTTKLIWPLLREKVPGLHLAGYATVPNATRPSPNEAAIDLDIEGRPLMLQLVRQCHWEVRYRREGESGDQAIASVGGQVANAALLLNVEPVTDDPPMSIVALNGRRVLHYNYDTLPAANIEAIGLEHTWRINAFPGLDLGGASAPAKR